MSDSDLLPASLRPSYEALAPEQQSALRLKSKTIPELTAGTPPHEHAEVIANVGARALAKAHEMNAAIERGIRSDSDWTAQAKAKHLAEAETAGRQRIERSYVEFAGRLDDLDRLAQSKIDGWHRQGVQDPGQEAGLRSQFETAMAAGAVAELLESHRYSADGIRSAVLRIGRNLVAGSPPEATSHAQAAKVALESFEELARPEAVSEALRVRAEVAKHRQRLKEALVPGILR